MADNAFPILRGKTLFRENELVYINKSTELQEYCNVLHKHDFLEITYVISGNGVHIVGDSKYEASKGDLFVINYDVPHGFFSSGTDTQDTIVYNCAFMPEFLDSSLFSSIHFQDITSSFLFKSLFPDDYKPSPDLRLHGTDFNEIGDLFSKMYSEYKLMKKGYSDIIRAYLIELVVRIFRYMEQSQTKSYSLQHKNLVDKALEHLKQNYNSDIKLDDLAIKSFVSKNYFSKLFKEVTGINFSDYIQKLRIDEACSLLKNTDYKISDIANQVGIKDMKSFYEVFKKITGETPGDYRKK